MQTSRGTQRVVLAETPGTGPHHVREHAPKPATRAGPGGGPGERRGYECISRVRVTHIYTHTYTYAWRTRARAPHARAWPHVIHTHARVIRRARDIYTARSTKPCVSRERDMTPTRAHAACTRARARAPHARTWSHVTQSNYNPPESMKTSALQPSRRRRRRTATFTERTTRPLRILNESR